MKTVENDLLVFTAASLQSAKARKLQNAGIELVRVPSRRGHIELKAVLKELGNREILSVMLESGPTLNGSALATKIVDKLFLFYAPKIAGRPTVPFVRGPIPAPRVRSHRVREQTFGPDFVIEAWLRDP